MENRKTFVSVIIHWAKYSREEYFKMNENRQLCKLE